MKHLALCMVLGLSAAACRDDDVSIPHEHIGVCRSCPIEFDLIASLGSPDDPDGPDPISSEVSTDRAGRWYVTAGPPAASVLVYAPDGTYQMSIGRNGQGPGEFNGARHIAVLHDTLHVFSSGPRHSRFALDGRVIDASRMPILIDRAFFFHNDTLVVYNSTRNAPPVHQVHNGTVLRSFGLATPAGITPMIPPHAAAQSADSVWLVDRFEYRIRLWGSDNRVHRTLERQASWFQWPQEVTKSAIGDVWLDRASGQLWVSAVHLLRSGREDHTPTTVAIIEVVDLDSGSLVAADSMVGMNPLRFTDQGDLYLVQQDTAGHNVISVWRPRIQTDSPTNNREGGK